MLDPSRDKDTWNVTVVVTEDNEWDGKNNKNKLPGMHERTCSRLLVDVPMSVRSGT